MTIDPALLAEWQQLDATARDLLAQRQRAYPGLVERGKLTPEEAERALRIMGGIAEQWRRVMAHQAIPDDYYTVLGAFQPEMLGELERSAARAGEIAQASPHDRAKADQARCVAALLWWQQPSNIADANPRPSAALRVTGLDPHIPRLWRQHTSELHWHAVEMRAAGMPLEQAA